jgi:hypothetical protein
MCDLEFTASSQNMSICWGLVQLLPSTMRSSGTLDSSTTGPDRASYNNNGNDDEHNNSYSSDPTCYSWYSTANRSTKTWII